MSTQFTKRALATGLGVGALALFGRRASADTSFTAFAFPATGAPTARTIPDRLAEVKNVRDFGAIGDGRTDDTKAIQAALNAAYGSALSPHGAAGATRNAPVFLPAGHYTIRSPLFLRSVRGAHIYGVGRFTTTIQNIAGGSVFVTNGCEYSRFEAMQLVASEKGVCFDLDWDNTGPSALQSNTFSDIYFQSGAYGLRIGNSDYMGSETLISNCFFANHSIAGLATMNFNALQQTVIGGNFQGCAKGIWVYKGSVPVISGVGFQIQSDTDIAIDNFANDSYAITGCRTESVNFLRASQIGLRIVVSGCAQTASTLGKFADTNAITIVDGCQSVNGQFTNHHGVLYLRGCNFQNARYVATFYGKVAQNI